MNKDLRFRVGDIVVFDPSHSSTRSNLLGKKAEIVEILKEKTFIMRYRVILLEDIKKIGNKFECAKWYANDHQFLPYKPKLKKFLEEYKKDNK